MVNFKTYNVIDCTTNMRNIFHENSYTKCFGDAIPRPFYKNSKLSISVEQQSEML